MIQRTNTIRIEFFWVVADKNKTQISQASQKKIENKFNWKTRKNAKRLLWLCVETDNTINGQHHSENIIINRSFLSNMNATIRA